MVLVTSGIVDDTGGVIADAGVLLTLNIVLTLGVIADVECCYQRGGLLLAAGIAIGILSYLLLIVGVVAEIECSADAEGYYSSRGLLLTLNVVTDAGNFYSLPFAD